MYLKPIFVGIKAEWWKVAVVRLSIQGLKQVGKIACAGIETIKKYCLCCGVGRMTGGGKMQEPKYKMLHRKDCLSRLLIFSKINWTNKKVLSFGKGSNQWMFYISLCQGNLFWAFAAGILWKLNPEL